MGVVPSASRGAVGRRWLHRRGDAAAHRGVDAVMPSPTVILAICLAVAVAALGVMTKLYLGKRDELAAEKQAFVSFRAQVKVLGEAAATKAKAQEMSDKLAKDTADAENAATVARLNASIAKLRHDADSARRSVLPAAPSGSKRPDLLCLDRAEYQREDGVLTERLLQGARGLADEGTKNTVGLATGQKWATELR